MISNILKISTVVAAINCHPSYADYPSIRVWIKSFIPIDSAYTLKAENGAWVIQAPDLPFNSMAPKAIRDLSGTCFSTDNRPSKNITPGPDQSARVTIDFTINFNGLRDIEVSASPGKSSIISIGSTRNVDCKSGLDVSSPQRASDSSITVGNIRKYQQFRTFNVRASAADPFYTVLGMNIAPRLDFEMVFEYDFIARRITIRGSSGVYPAYEAFYSVNGTVHEIFSFAPDKKTSPLSLYDFGTGINTSNFSDYIIDLRSIR